MSITERIRYGAAELKSNYNRHLTLAFIVSIALHAAAIALYVLTTTTAIAVPDERVDGSQVTVIDKVKTKLPPLDPPPGGDGSEPQRPAKNFSKSTSKIGRPLIIDDSEESVDTFATTPTLPNANVDANKINGTVEPLNSNIGNGGNGVGGNGGDGVGGNGGNGNGSNENGEGTNGIDPADNEPLDATAEFYSDVELPSVDMSELTARIIYPRIASQHDIEGEVLVRALIGIDGLPEKVEVKATSNRIFNDAALDAVRTTRFTPAAQNDTPVRVWIEIPIKFKLD